jgi:hypothetical protein
MNAKRHPEPNEQAPFPDPSAAVLSVTPRTVTSTGSATRDPRQDDGSDTDSYPASDPPSSIPEKDSSNGDEDA